MKKEQVIWTIVLGVAGAWILGRMAFGYMTWPVTGPLIGTWVAAFFTLALFSFLYRDNPIYKIAEHAFVGVSAAYWMVAGFWTTLEPNLLGKLAPNFTRATFRPGVAADASTDWWYLVPLLLGGLLLWRLSPKGGWIARWPLAFIIGATAGFRLVGFLETDFLLQIEQSMRRVADFGVPRGTAIIWASSIDNLLVVLFTLSALTYFFFSFEQKGVVGKISRMGILVLMITFGAGFGFTVMGRVALLVGRIQFLLYEWLQIARP